LTHGLRENPRKMAVWCLQYRPPMSRQLLVNAAAAGAMAPSSHNTQPWRFRLVDDALELHADPRRHLSVIDGERRQLIESCGCALFNARVAMRAMGVEDDVELFPDVEDPDHLATLRCGNWLISEDVDRDLLRAIPLRHTNRRPFLPRPVSLADSRELIALASRPGVWLGRLDPDQKRRLGRVIDEADRTHYGNPVYRAELTGWLVTPGARRRDGIPLEERAYRSPMPLEKELVRTSPVVMVLGTYGDGPRDWLEAGQALEALLLHATLRGLSAAFLNQALELPALRREVTRIIDRGEHPQMILRLGYPELPVEQPAPRRNLEDLLLVVD
jgi:nitroreductase